MRLRLYDFGTAAGDWHVTVDAEAGRFGTLGWWEVERVEDAASGRQVDANAWRAGLSAAEESRLGDRVQDAWTLARADEWADRADDARDAREER